MQRMSVMCEDDQEVALAGWKFAGVGDEFHSEGGVVGRMLAPVRALGERSIAPWLSRVGVAQLNA